MEESSTIVTVTVNEMQETFTSILVKYNFTEERALECAKVFTESSIDGIYTHGVNRFPRFVQYIMEGYVKPGGVPSLENKLGGIEQWNGNLGPGILNAVQVTGTVMSLADQYGIGCVALRNTNHWMRGGTYAWQAAKAGYVFIGWTNTIANMPAWGAKDAKLGNNPLVMALPYKNEAIVLDMAMSQYSYGALELAEMKNEPLSVYGGFDNENNLTKDPSAILSSNNPLPIGYWKGAGLSLLLDLLATVLSGGLSTHEISKKEVEYGLSQVFIAINISKLNDQSAVGKTIEAILNDYHQSIPVKGSKKIVYPGERVLQTRKNNLANGIPVLKKIWEEIKLL
ncbi:MAG: 3-dehydro-L-gulonate 2-dehydrogenase [Ginsengibacter sp.]